MKPSISCKILSISFDASLVLLMIVTCHFVMSYSLEFFQRKKEEEEGKGRGGQPGDNGTWYRASYTPCRTFSTLEE